MRIAAAMAPIMFALVVSACGDDRHDERLRTAGPDPTFEVLKTVADPEAGARKFGACAACHTVSKGVPDANGPNLHGVFGKRMGENSARFGYTAALVATGGQWDEPTLDAWIANPKAVVPGTSMQFAGVADPLDRADIIAFLKRQAE